MVTPRVRDMLVRTSTVEGGPLWLQKKHRNGKVKESWLSSSFFTRSHGMDVSRLFFIHSAPHRLYHTCTRYLQSRLVWTMIEPKGYDVSCISFSVTASSCYVGSKA